MDAPSGSRPVPLEHEDRELLMQARTRALATMQVVCSPAHRASLQEKVAELDERLAKRATPSAAETSTSSPDLPVATPHQRR